MLTVNANVFVSASSRGDISHADSDLCLARIRHFGQEVHCPTLILPETASAIVRPTSNLVAAQMAIVSVETFPGMRLETLTDQRAQRATQVALTYRLRGADAVYVAVAQEFGATLITWDKEMLTRGGLAVPTMTPTDWLAANPV